MLDIEESDAIHFYSNSFRYYFKPRITTNIIDILEVLKLVALQLPVTNKPTNKPDLTKLPLEFHALTNYIQEWDISDDLARSEKLKKTSKADKKLLVQIAHPLFDQINKYLDSLNDALSTEAMALQKLGETVSEIMNEEH